jgi:hypothetical protein
VSTHQLGGRRNWRIAASDLTEFLNTRANTAAPTRPPTRRRAARSAAVEFIQ